MILCEKEFLISKGEVIHLNKHPAYPKHVFHSTFAPIIAAVLGFPSAQLKHAMKLSIMKLNMRVQTVSSLRIGAKELVTNLGHIKIRSTDRLTKQLCPIACPPPLFSWQCEHKLSSISSWAKCLDEFISPHPRPWRAHPHPRSATPAEWCGRELDS